LLYPSPHQPEVIIPQVFIKGSPWLATALPALLNCEHRKSPDSSATCRAVLCEEATAAARVAPLFHSIILSQGICAFQCPFVPFCDKTCPFLKIFLKKLSEKEENSAE
jgi:hypothetical protein